MVHYIEIRSTDNTGVFIVIEKIQYIIQTSRGCDIGLDNGKVLSSGANFNDLTQILKKGATQ